MFRQKRHFVFIKQTFFSLFIPSTVLKTDLICTLVQVIQALNYVKGEFALDDSRYISVDKRCEWREDKDKC